MKSYLKMETHPLADPKNVVKGDKYRITVLTSIFFGWNTVRMVNLSMRHPRRL